MAIEAEDANQWLREEAIERKRAEAAEARCARLEEALREPVWVCMNAGCLAVYAERSADTVCPLCRTTLAQAHVNRAAHAEDSQTLDERQDKDLTYREALARASRLEEALRALRQKFDDYRTFSGNEAVSPRPQASRSYRAERQAEVGVFNMVISEIDAALASAQETTGG